MSTIKLILIVVFAIIYFGHLIVCTGAGYTILRLWQDKDNPLIFRLSLFMYGSVCDLLQAIILVFIAKDVKFTWKFSVVLFILILLKDLFRLPLIIYLLRGSKQSEREVTNAESPVHN